MSDRRLFLGDNLGVLRGLPSASVDLIVTDPPFAKGRDFGAISGSETEGASFSDQWAWDETAWSSLSARCPRLVWLVEGARGLHGEGMAAFLCFMALRLVEMRRVLKSTGSIYLQCDYTARPYLRLALDAVFGHANFRNEIAWCYKGPRRPGRTFPRKHDVILFYARSEDAEFRSDAVRIPYFRDMARSGSGKFAVGLSAEESLERRKELTRIGRVVEDWWADIGSGAHMPPSERVGYPTQKPLALCERMIRASSDEGDLVLDPFMGSGTTLLAAERLGRRWAGVDVSSSALGASRRRLADYCGLMVAEVEVRRV